MVHERPQSDRPQSPITSSGMRIAIVVGTLVSEQLSVWTACSHLGIDVTLIGTTVNIHEERWPWRPAAPSDVPSVILQPMSPALQRGPQLWMYRRLGTTLRRLRPNLIHVESEPWGGLTVQTLLARRLMNVPALVCAHGADSIYWHGSMLERLVRRAILSATLRELDGFVSRNRDGIRLAVGAGLPPTTPRKVLPAVVPDPDLFVPPTAEQRKKLREQYGLPQDMIIVGYLGRLVDEKGVRDLLQALTMQESKHPFLVVWGSGPLENLIHTTFLKGDVRGRLGGALDRPEVANALRAVDIVVVPSRTTSEWREHFGRVVLESLLSGCAVVAYASGAIPEVMGDSGVLVAEGDVPNLARAIGTLVSDDQRRNEVAAKQREHAVREFRPAIVAQQLIDFWSLLLSDRT